MDIVLAVAQNSIVSVASKVKANVLHKIMAPNIAQQSYHVGQSSGQPTTCFAEGAKCPSQQIGVSAIWEA